MAPNPRVAKAFRAMRDLGIAEEKVKPVLKSLLKLYDKNWELIEAENYRALADAIFDQEEAQAAEEKKKLENTNQVEMDEEDQVPEPPLKRLRLRYQEGHASPSLSNSCPGLAGNLLKQPKEEEAEPPETFPQPDIVGSSQPSQENVRGALQPMSPQRITRSKAKQSVLPKPSPVQERLEPSQPGVVDRNPPFAAGRTQSDSVNPRTRLREKGKEPISPQIGSRDKSSNSERSPHAVRIKEPGIALLPKQQMHKSHTLVKPKDEPFTDDLPHSVVPIAVIHPEPFNKENSSNGSLSIREANGLDPVSQAEAGKGQSSRVQVSTIEKRTNCELANYVDESSSNLEIASSPYGEVKISLTCNSALGGPDFHVPSVDAVVKMVEDKCLRSYKLLDPSFSVMKLMKDMCECFLELGTDSANESQGKLDVAPAVDISKQCNGLDTLGARDEQIGYPINPVSDHCAAEVAQSQIPNLPPSSNMMDDSGQTDKNTIVSSSDIDEERQQNDLEHSSSHSLVVVQQPEDGRHLHDVSNIAKGQEKVVISLANEINNECPPSFYYIPQNVVFQNAYVNFSLARIGENCCSTCSGDCLSSTTPCACSHETGGEFAYTLDGLVKEDFLEECISMNRDPQKHCLFYCKECPLERSKNEDILEPCKGHLVRRFIKECWWKCGCSKHCGNRVVQRGINCKLQVFMTAEGKGWGLRTLQDLPKGAFVCEYVGEILTNAELYERVSQSSSNEEHAYPVLLDADWGSEGVLKDEEALCLDATHFGNVARFINHRCFDSNLVEIPVEVETPDHHYYHLAFFTTRKVEALEELTWDYGIDFDDQDHPIKAFKCRCSSKFCRNIKRSSRSRSAAANRR
ncbi:probable inactive histone-lysine N-methyltransferase SUVR2 isoform X3 [Diospyros lotus]|uniref:probable inactive histone-lysine N-methyltransferase SUVR2 isoform X3 n=1 Tax=Diospyros lotus TaxID=55363 RepID=UPI002253C246|nr:probable inactive histone-lysine N-methyltransferase SUVR2 isoform X3 [Diospyros lotus]